jgi:hypothetical protein
MRDLELKAAETMPTSTLQYAAQAELPAGGATTLTKAELADMLFERVGLNKREAKDMVETFFE